MPQMDGFQVLAIVRRKFPTLRVVVMTAMEDEQFRARAYAMDIDLYIEKPKTGKEIINFVDCIESMLEKEDSGGFRGVQSKTLVDIVQLECLTQSSAILKIASAHGEGRIWIQRGEIIDAATGECLGKEAFLEMLRWKAGSFEILPNEVPRPRTIFSSYESLLMETAQTIDETESDRPPAEEENPLAGFARYKGVQMVVAVDGTDPTKVEHWGPTTPRNWRRGCITPRGLCTPSASASKAARWSRSKPSVRSVTSPLSPATRRIWPWVSPARPRCRTSAKR